MKNENMFFHISIFPKVSRAHCQIKFHTEPLLCARYHRGTIDSEMDKVLFLDPSWFCISLSFTFCSYCLIPLLITSGLDYGRDLY